MIKRLSSCAASLCVQNSVMGRPSDHMLKKIDDILLPCMCPSFKCDDYCLIESDALRNNYVTDVNLIHKVNGKGAPILDV